MNMLLIPWYTVTSHGMHYGMKEFRNFLCANEPKALLNHLLPNQNSQSELTIKYQSMLMIKKKSLKLHVKPLNFQAFLKPIIEHIHVLSDLNKYLLYAIMCPIVFSMLHLLF